MEQKRAEVLFLDDARSFVYSQPLPVVKKIFNVIDRVLGGEMNSVIFKKIDHNGIWEFRISYENMAYRLLAFWDIKQSRLIVATHGFIKKKQKTPQKEIKKAIKMMGFYYKEKDNNSQWNK